MYALLRFTRHAAFVFGLQLCRVLVMQVDCLQSFALICPVYFVFICYLFVRSAHPQASFSMHSDTDETAGLLDEMEDIPLQEIDEIDCLKNASVKILLSFIEFLEEGKLIALLVTFVNKLFDCIFTRNLFWH